MIDVWAAGTIEPKNQLTGLSGIPLITSIPSAFQEWEQFSIGTRVLTYLGAGSAHSPSKIIPILEMRAV
jgi:hypothetical protein